MLVATWPLLVRHLIILHVLLVASCSWEWVLICLDVLHGRHASLLRHLVIEALGLEVVLSLWNVLSCVVLVAVVLLLEVAHLLSLHVVLLRTRIVLLIPLSLGIVGLLVWILHRHVVSLWVAAHGDHVLIWHLIDRLGHGVAHHLLTALVVLVCKWL